MAPGDLELVEPPPPILLEGLWAWEAFNELSTDRPVGMGVGPIPWSSLDRYASRYKFDTERFDDLRFHVRRLDDLFLEHQNRDKGAGK